ncbi:MAG: hypothetical protein FE048_00035 [Thermoplasmata archaeon]|nr:MAG: hypothetical protein FE048_00035 [Thermoplasmata archaeon]
MIVLFISSGLLEVTNVNETKDFREMKTNYKINEDEMIYINPTQENNNYLDYKQVNNYSEISIKDRVKNEVG